MNWWTTLIWKYITLTLKVFVCQELLEKYGYLDCVPSGSEANTRLHRLLLYRRRHLLPSGPDTLDGSMPASGKHMLMKDLHQRHNSDEDEEFEKAISGTRAPTEDKPQLGASKGIPSSSSSRNPDKDLVKYIDSKRRTVTVWDPFSGHLHHLPICSPGDIAKAVRKFQVSQRCSMQGCWYFFIEVCRIKGTHLKLYSFKILILFCKWNGKADLSWGVSCLNH